MSAVIGSGSAASDWAAAFQGSPILLKGGTGIATQGDIPITTYTDPNPQPGVPAFAQYMPMPGASLLKNQLSKFPFANQAVAANAIIQQPVNLSMMMICPVQGGQSWQVKLSILTAMVQTVKQHFNLGGLFNVNTPSFPYTSGALLDLRDMSQSETKQPQYKYAWDFEFPLITLEQAQAVLNTLLNKLSNQSAPNPTVPTVGTALSAVGVSAPSFTQALTNQLGPSLASVGLNTVQLPGVVGASVQTALAGNFSSLDLATDLASKYLPAAQAIGLSPVATLGLMNTGVTFALGQVGVTPDLMSTLFKASLGSVQIPGISSGLLQ
jgi:hypothetical protein